jgi:diguanylate cyclase (GGDEF)-like protein/PAS domain S-box-containing protein
MQNGRVGSTVSRKASEQQSTHLLDLMKLQESCQQQDSECFFQTLLQAFPIPIAIARVTDSRLLYANEFFKTAFGVESVETPISLHSYFEPGAWPVLRQALWQYNSLTNYELKLQTPQGKTLWGLVSLQLLACNGEPWIVGTFHDITYQKQIEQALQANSRSLSTLMNRLPDTIYRCSCSLKPGTFELISPACTQLTGYSPEDLTHRSSLHFEDLIHPDDRDRVAQILDSALAQKHPYNLEYRLLTRDGSQKWVWERGYGIWSPTGQLQAREGSIVEITKRKQLEEESQLLHTLMQTIGQTSTFEDALQATLQGVCQATNWVYGEAWIPNEEDPNLTLGSAWHDPNSTVLSQFRQYSADFCFPKGIGLPGMVWLAREPRWLADVSESPQFVRRHLAQLTGLKAGFGVPILAGDRVIAILVFFMNQPQSRDRSLSEIVSVVASQLGELCQRKHTEAALRESERRLTSLINTTDGIFFAAASDPEYSMTYISEGCAKLTGYTSQELVRGKPLSYSMMICAEDRDRVLKTMKRCIQQQKTYVLEYRLQTRSGEEKWVWEKGHGVYSETGQLLSVEGFITDITERKQSEEALARAETKYRSIFENALEGIFQTTPDGHYLSANPALARIYGYSSVDELMASLTDIEHQLYVDPSQRQEFIQLMQKRGAVQGFESQIYRRDGSTIWICESARAVHDDRGILLYYEGMVEDITERKLAKEQLHLRAFYDPLTGLPNRSLFQSRLAAALERSKREEIRGKESPYQFAVLFLDLDRFKLVNDSLGHLMGDRLLIAVARRLENCLREQDTVARLGGDEFTILLEDVADLSIAIHIAERINRELDIPFDLSGHQVYAGASIGIVLSRNLAADTANPPRYQNPDDLLRDADIALYRAKSLGKGRYEVFNSQMQQNSSALLQLETDLRQAMNRNEFKIEYQPIVALDAKKLIGFEALLRWHHPRKGWLYPKDFFSIAEESGVTVPIARWMLKTACRQLNIFQEQNPDYPLLLHLNFSAKQFLQPDLLEQIDRVCAETGLSCANLCLEISENLWIKNADATKIRITQLRDRDVKLCIDDFGTGYSCLTDLHAVTIDTFKIDRSFLREIENNPGKAEIARSIVMLARSLGATAIAEGIETEAQLQKMCEFGCDLGQGYFFSGPLSPETAQGWITPNPSILALNTATP